mgnify:CR=1 FL=1
MDGNPLTSWRAQAFGDVIGTYVRIEVDEPTTTDHLTLLQPVAQDRNRWITEVQLRLQLLGHGVDLVELTLLERQERRRPTVTRNRHREEHRHTGVAPGIRVDLDARHRR